MNNQEQQVSIDDVRSFISGIEEDMERGWTAEAFALKLARIALASLEADVSAEEKMLAAQAKAAIHCLDMCEVPAGDYADNPQLKLWGRIIEYGRIPAPDLERDALRKLVDIVWSDAAESPTYLSTEWADRLIDQAFPGGLNTPPAPVDLAALVPHKIPSNVYNLIYQECGGFVDSDANAQAIWNACRAEMLRRIEGKDKC